MTLIGFANTQRLAIGVSLPAGCGLVLPRRPLGPQITDPRWVADRLASHLFQRSASRLVPNRRRKQVPIIASGLSLVYFPL